MSDLPVIGNDRQGREVKLGGFSGLFFVGKSPGSGDLNFLALTNKGPGKRLWQNQPGRIAGRSFILPHYSPRLVELQFSSKSKTARVVQATELKGFDRRPITGLPNRHPSRSGAFADELGFDEQGRALEPDPLGADFGGVVQVLDGSVWMADRYGPSLFHFTEQGALLERFVPEGSGLPGVEALPSVYNLRRLEQGFGAIAYDRGRIYALFEAPLGVDPTRAKSRVLRILEFDLASSRAVGEYIYPLEPGEAHRVGDAVSLGQKRFLVLEKGKGKFLSVFRIGLQEATNVTHHLWAKEKSLPLEAKTIDGLAEMRILPVDKTLVLDLAAEGYASTEALEGMALVDSSTIAFISQDHFGVSGAKPALGSELILAHLPAIQIAGDISATVSPYGVKWTRPRHIPNQSLPVPD